MKTKLLILIALIIAITSGLFFWYRQNTHAQNYARGLVQDPLELIAHQNDRTNIALLGIGGEGHQGADLTDSILVLSIYHPTKTISILSIPRDLWLSDQQSKINAIYLYAEQQNPGSGLSKIKDALTQVTSLPIHYAILIDFSGFIKAIDSLGGIDVVVDNTFDDYKYPIPGKENAEPESDRYEHIHFDAGETHMDGITALKYVRSRHAEGDEGTDFARSTRQQKVIRAFLKGIISTKTVFNPERIQILQSTINQSLKHDIPEQAVSALTKLSLNLDFDNIKNLSIESLLTNPKNLKPYYGQWVLIPTSDWDSIHQYVQENI